MRIKRLLALHLLATIATPAVTLGDQIDDIVHKEMDKQHIAGLSLAVMKGGQIVKARGYGYANLEHRIKASADSIYEIGSITKQFTATCIMKLVEQGKLGLDDKLSKYVDGTPTSWSDVTIRHLLTHTSGIKNYTSVLFFERLTVLPTTHAGLLKLISGFPLDFKPGDKWSYSNSGYYLLGMVIEKVSGKSYADYLQTNIFDPLGMKSTHVNDLRDVIENRASGYDWTGKVWRNALVIDMTWPFSAGAIITNVEDMAKWDAALYTEKLLRQATLQMMWTPATLNDGSKASYGFGWSLESKHGHRKVSHGGGIPGFITQESRYPDDRLTVDVFTNSGSSDPGLIADAVAGTYISELAPTIYAIPPKVDPDPALTSRIRKAISVTCGGEDSPDFTADGNKTAHKFPHKDLLITKGQIDQCRFVYQTSEPAYGQGNVKERRYYLMILNGKVHHWIINMTADHKIEFADLTD